MASKRIDISVNGKDNTSSAFNSVAKNIDKVSKGADKAGTTVGQSISKGASTASSSLGKMATTANSSFQKIVSGASAAGRSIAGAMDTAGGAMTGLIGSLGAYEIAQQAWTGAATADFNRQFLATKMSTEAANEYVKSIQGIVAAVPGPDTWMNNLLSGAVQKQTNISNDALSQLGKTAADYYITSIGMGKSQIETQNDLMEYIKTGNTSQLERDSILKDQLGTLKDQATVEDRVKALQTAMIADGYDGVSALKTASNYWEQFNGLIGRSATTLGNLVLPTISSILSALIELDSSTNGWSTNLIVVGGLLAGMITTLGLISGPLSAMVGMWRTVGGGIKNATASLWKYVVAAKAADKADDGVGTGGSKLTAGNVVKSGAIIGGLAAIGIAITDMWDAANQGAIKALSTASYLEKDENGVYHEQFWRSPIPAINDFNRSIGLGTQNAFNVIKNAGAGLQTSLNGVWGSISNGAAAGWNSIRLGAQNSFNSITNAWNNLKSLVGQGARGVVSIFGPTIGSIRSAVSSLWSLVRGGASGVVTILSSGIDYVRSAVSSLYNMVRAGAKGVVSIVQSIVGGPGGPRGPRGPSGPEDSINFNYENYGGWQKNAWTGTNSMSGNCADMTAGLISRYGGSYVSGTWNGNPHVWWKSPSGYEFDPARKALNGTGSPPPRGPSSGSNGGAIIIQGDVYGFDDFKKKVEQANNKIFRGRI